MTKDMPLTSFELNATFVVSLCSTRKFPTISCTSQTTQLYTIFQLDSPVRRLKLSWERGNRVGIADRAVLQTPNPVFNKRKADQDYSTRQVTWYQTFDVVVGRYEHGRISTP